MTFTKTTNPPATDARVIVNFAGLMVLKPGTEADTCSIGVHRWASNHTFQVILTVFKPQSLPILMRLYTGYFDQPCEIRLVRNQDGSDLPSDFKAYAAADGDIVRDDASADRNPLDYRWGLNLKKFYSSEPLDINDGAKPLVTLKTGVLYTSHLTHRTLLPKLKKAKPFPTEIGLGYFSARLAAAITLPENTTLKLKWSEQGKTGGIDLPRSYDQNTTYVVTLINDPPTNYPTPHQEMRHYYDVVTVEGALEDRLDYQWRLEHAQGQSTDRIPCMPIIIE